jgi:hypothetical protein
MKRAVLVGGAVAVVCAAACAVESGAGRDGRPGGAAPEGVALDGAVDGPAPSGRGDAGDVTTAGAGGGGPADPTWQCLGLPLNPSPSNTLITVTLGVFSGTTRRPATSAVVRSCARADVDCANPVAADAPVGRNGFASVLLPQNFDGFFEVRSTDPDPATAFVPELGFLPAREIMRGAVGRGLLVFTRGEIGQFTALSGGSFDPTAPGSGVLITTALNCDHRSAPGVAFALTSPGQATAQTRSFYFNQGLPNPNATQTDTSGVFGLTNLLAGTVTVSGSIVASQEPLAPNAAATVRDGWITILYASP